MASNFFIADDPLSLEGIRSVLIRLEDTIIFQLIERAQFAHNPKMYERGAFSELKDIGFDGCWLEWFLEGIEGFHGSVLFFLFFFFHLNLKHFDSKGT
jgi:chorismate mutase